jgi:RhtB (resistance to homoserine/threonine) family protein
MEYLTPFIAVGVISILGAMSPGPDLAVVAKNSLFGSRRTGLYTAIGIALGILLHVAYSLLGIGFLIAQSIVLFTVIKYIGAVYLLYLGYQLLSAKREVQTGDGVTHSPISISSISALKEGFLTNAFNPKVTLFFLSIFTQVIDPAMPLAFQALLGLEVAVIAGLWFTSLAFLITHKPVKETFAKTHYYLMKIMGGALIFLGVKLAFETKE